MAKKQTAKKLTWPNCKKVAVSVTVMFETWPDDSAPNYSVQTTHLKKGTVDYAAKAWSTYGGRVGVWRLVRLLERLGVPATFFVNGRCTEQYPDAVKQIVKSGFDIAAHSYTQDDLLSYKTVEEQQAVIRQSIDLLEACGGKKVTGWGSPVVAFTPETAGFLKQAGLKWTCDVTYEDLPIKIDTPHGPLAGVPTTDYSDNRVLRASSRDLFDVHRGTFDYLRENETIGLQTLVIHCQFGGRPLISAVLAELLKYMAKTRDVWFARHEELADWVLKQDVDVHTYQARYFDPVAAMVTAPCMKAVRPLIELKSWRESHTPPISQENAGEMVGVKKATWSRWEAGIWKPKTDTVPTISDVTGIAPEVLRPDVYRAQAEVTQAPASKKKR